MEHKKGFSINGYRKHISFYKIKDHHFAVDYKYIVKELLYDTYYYAVAVGSEYELVTGKEIIFEGCKETPIREIEIIKYIDIFSISGNWNWNLTMMILNALKVYNTLKDQTKIVPLVDIMLLMNSRSKEHQFRKVFNCKYRDMYLVFEKYGEGLDCILDRKEPPLEISNIQQQKWLLTELLSAVSSLHSQKLVHRDLRPSSVCVNFVAKTLKLNSFGLSCGFLSEVYLEEEEDDEEVTDDEITPVYTPPEIILGHGGASSPSVDVWGLGCIFAEILNGGSPLFFLPPGTKPTTSNKIGVIVATLQQNKGTSLFSDRKNTEGFIENAQFPTRSGEAKLGVTSRNKGTSLDKLFPSNPNVVDLLSRMLDLDPHTRISLEEVKQHAYFDGGSSSRVVALVEEEDMRVAEVTVPDVVEPDIHSLRKLIWKEMETFETNKKKKTQKNTTFEMKKRTFEVNREVFEVNKKTSAITT